MIHPWAKLPGGWLVPHKFADVSIRAKASGEALPQKNLVAIARLLLYYLPLRDERGNPY